MIGGVGKVVVEADDQDRARRFWTETMGFELVQDTPYGEGGARWLEVRTPDGAMVLVLGLRHRHDSDSDVTPSLPTSPVFFYCDDLPRTHQELSARGVEFPQPPVEMFFGWWSMFQDPDGNRFALVPRGQ